MRSVCLLCVIGAVLVMGCGKKPGSEQVAQGSGQGASSRKLPPLPPVSTTPQPQPASTQPQQTTPAQQPAVTQPQQTTQPQQPAATQPQQVQKQPDPKLTTEPEGVNAKTISGIARIMDAPEVRNHMKQLAIFYKTYESTNGPVKSVAAFKDFIRRDAPPKLREQLEANYYVIVPNLRNPGSNTVIAYERLSDRADQHIVAMGDGSVQQMGTPELRAALQKK